MYGVPPRPDSQCDVCGCLPSANAIAASAARAASVDRARAAAPVEALGASSQPVLHGLTVNIEGAAEILHTTVPGIRMRRSRGKMPEPLTKNPLVWKVSDLLKVTA